MSPLNCDSVRSVMQIKDEQGNFKNENFSELRHVAFGIKDQEDNAGGEKPAPARSASLSLSFKSATNAVRNGTTCMCKLIPWRNLIGVHMVEHVRSSDSLGGAEGIST